MILSRCRDGSHVKNAVLGPCRTTGLLRDRDAEWSQGLFMRVREDEAARRLVPAPAFRLLGQKNDIIDSTFMDTRLHDFRNAPDELIEIWPTSSCLSSNERVLHRKASIGHILTVHFVPSPLTHIDRTASITPSEQGRPDRAIPIIQQI
jgi:hypothetical protein